jgi:hypothetical protein
MIAVDCCRALTAERVGHGKQTVTTYVVRIVDRPHPCPVTRIIQGKVVLQASNKCRSDWHSGRAVTGMQKAKLL